ncbi:MAG: NHLP bacteriocin system secretion protein [Deltaproteobacteria bacterium]|nr:NHLP bacteriocin system secretion protein [Deltaproteobacteria bacterium]
MKPSKIFRREALDRLATPEQLHTLMQVTNPRSWLALLGCALVLAAAGLWSVRGHIPTKVDASGILLHAGGLANVVAVSEGQLSSLEVEPGDLVRAGQIIARVSQPELRQQIGALEARVADLTVQREVSRDSPGDGSGTGAAGRLPSPAGAAPETEQPRQPLVLAKVRLQLELLREQLAHRDRVVSTQDGRVVEVRASVGDLVAPGIPIVSVERTGERAPLEALLFVDSREGKTLRPGMLVEISPSVVSRERDGVLLGRVRAVEGFPSTRQGMMRLLRNEELVESFIQEAGGTPIALRAELLTARRSPSGYRWSSGKGPDVVLTSGTRCSAAVTTRNQRPVALVFPALDFGG